MFGSLKNAFSSFYNQVSSRLNNLFSRAVIDESMLDELEKILLSADVGVVTTRKLIEAITQQLKEHPMKGEQVKQLLSEQLVTILSVPAVSIDKPVQLLVGINGSGKTTVAGKLAHRYSQQGKKVLLVAADTFRAAAVQQLQEWALRTQVAIVTGSNGQDPASVVFAGCMRFIQEKFDYLIIDTAGRLQTKTNLMQELSKIKRVITKIIHADQIITLLTIDAMLGQNSLEQAKLFHESTNLDGIILTKTDGTGKGGIICAITDQFKLPVIYISYGEQPEALSLFSPHDYINSLMSIE